MLNNNQPWKKNDAEGCIYVTTGSYYKAEICELFGINILLRLSTIVDKNDCGVYRDDSALVLRNVIGQSKGRVIKSITTLFKGNSFLISILLIV